MRIHHFRPETNAGLLDGDAVGHASAISGVSVTGGCCDDDDVGRHSRAGAVRVRRNGAGNSRRRYGLLIWSGVGSDGDVVVHDVLDARRGFDRLLSRPSALGKRIAKTVPESEGGGRMERLYSIDDHRFIDQIKIISFTTDQKCW